MPRSRWLTLLLLLGVLALAPRQPAPAPVDLLLTNGRVLTMEEGAPEAEAVAVRGERIVAVGTSAGLLQYRGPATRVIDLHGQLRSPASSRATATSPASARRSCS